MTALRGSSLALLLHQRLSRMEIEELQRYAETVEKLLASEAARFEIRLDSFAAGLPEAERDGYLEQYADEYQELKEGFPNHLRYSLLISCYSTLESRLVSIAKALLKLQKTRLAISDFGGNSPLAKARICIDKVAGLGLSKELWTTLEPFRLVRNAVVHGAGQFADKPPPVVANLAKSKAQLRIDSTGYVQLGSAFVPAFFETMERFYAGLFSAWGSCAHPQGALSLVPADCIRQPLNSNVNCQGSNIY